MIHYSETPDPMDPRIFIENLTPREMETLRMLTMGKCYKQIGMTWKVSRASVKRYAEKMREKLGAQTNEEAVFKAAKIGLV